MRSILLEQLHHVLVRSAMSTGEGECDGVLQMEVTDCQSIGIAECDKAGDGCSPHTDSGKPCQLFGGSRRINGAIRK